MDEDANESPKASRALARSWHDEFCGIKVSAGASVTDVATPGVATRNTAYPTSDPTRAIIQVDPGVVCAVARPATLMLAMLGLSTTQLIAMSEIVSNVSSSTAARYCTVADGRIRVSPGRTVMKVGMPVTRTGTSVTASPLLTRIVVCPTADEARTSPVLLTETIELSKEANATATPVTRWPSPSNAVTDKRTESLRNNWTESGLTSSVKPGPSEFLQAHASRISSRANEMERIGVENDNAAAEGSRKRLRPRSHNS